jgi:hypothetical protein
MNKEADKMEIEITARDRVLRAWEDSMELVRDFQTYAKETESDAEVSHMFYELADAQCEHAAKLRELLDRRQTQDRGLQSGHSVQF